MPKFSYFPNDDEFDDSVNYVKSEKIIRHKPKKSNHLGKSQNKNRFNNEW